MDTLVADRMVARLRDIILSISDAEEKSMYGGTVFVLPYVEPKRLFCGIFARRNYVTVEFDRGVELSDARGLLEGSGRRRRHLKLYAESDIESRSVADFV